MKRFFLYIALFLFNFAATKQKRLATMRRIILLVALFVGLAAQAQPKFSEPHGLYDAGSMEVTISGSEGAEIRYTTDGSEPTVESILYTGPLSVDKTMILRAVEVKDGKVSSPVSTVSYIFTKTVISQSDSPEGYPTKWGKYSQIGGTAKADYGMDPEMTGDANLCEKIKEGLKQLPILSIVTDKDNLFSHENDEETGGIYIFTGPPVGDTTGHGWTRAASAELFGGPQHHDLSTTCGLRLHGGHGRLAEKNPKHSLRLVFKDIYGPKTLNYPVFGDGETVQFKQLVLRCHFGNSWQHWSEGNRQKAQYTRDVWTRRMQKKMGRTSVNALYVHLFLNGMYWGLYNIAERVDDQYGKDHLGGGKSDIDVIKIEEDNGNHIEASEGTLDAWNKLVATVPKAASKQGYEALKSLLDIDAFIDYMLINQYAGNTDWAHHNWYAIYRRGEGSQGFRFLCWDSEMIMEGEKENVVTKNNGDSFPTGIFHHLMKNPQFAQQYVNRASELLSDGGLLSEASVVEVWDSLYHTIDMAIYDEAARWGDYRRDVHPYQTRGELYTVDNHYMKERNRLLTEYFPVRSQRVLKDIIAFAGIEPSGIRAVNPEPSTTDYWYTLDGRRLSSQPGQKGIYIRNGRKVIQK